MKVQNLSGGQELLCVNVDKVYDWVTNQASVNLPGTTITFPAGVLDPCAAGTTILDIAAVVTVGTVTEVGERVNRTFIINGAEVTLQRVTIVKPLSIAVTVTALTATGTQITVTGVPIPATVTESFFLCAPEGTDITVTAFDSESSVSGSCVAGALVVDIAAVICQSIQVTAPVTIELTADFCAARENIIAACPAPAIPPQCPALFPTPLA
ncbi:hypothetical protein BIV60_13840 [Bacillus sp. MUM 116]|uniref:hypothetical protein n=1 Tax=Bacillus sp. MUM 116 TaxID=1678002 RepID=UPI0008F56AA2|nr:hypothetical protein [Bacillus sp. MUM 116]OIK13571.1 hypothetical protein BIV60_13840 [Bacillus sp. MUM 116]